LGDNCFKGSNTNLPDGRQEGIACPDFSGNKLTGEFPQDIGTGIGHEQLLNTAVCSELEYSTLN